METPETSTVSPVAADNPSNTQQVSNVVDPGKQDAVVAEAPKSVAGATPAQPRTPEPVSQTGQPKDPVVDKNYQELRAWTTRASQENAALRKQINEQNASLKQLTEMFTKATEKPYDPDQFMEEFRQQGPKFIEKQLEAALTSKVSAYAERMDSIQSELAAVRTEAAVKDCRLDSANFPDFQKLEPDMQKILDSGVIPQEEVQSKPLPELLNQLFQMAKLQHSQEAIKAAESNGRKAAEAELAREARSGVAGGGRVVGQMSTDLKTASAAELKKHFAGLGMVE